MDDSNGNRVADGTANIGGTDQNSTLRQRIAATLQHEHVYSVRRKNPVPIPPKSHQQDIMP